MNSDTKLAEFWEKKLIPIFNGIFFKTGVVKALALDSGSNINLSESTWLSAVVQSAPEMLSSIDVRAHLKLNTTQEFCFGGGSFGGDTFIAYLEYDKIEWIIFLDWYSDLNYCEQRDDGSLIFFQDSYSRDALELAPPMPETIKLVTRQI